MRAGEGSSGSLALIMSARLPAKLFSTSLKSSCGRRNVHSAAQIMRIYSLAKRASDDSPEVQRNNKRGRFLKKLWCCVGRRVKQVNLLLSTELIT